MQDERKTYLLTGGAGFIGSQLAEHLLNLGFGVTVVDNFSTGSIINIAHLRGRPRFQYVIDDVCDRQLIEKLVEECDYIFHFATGVDTQILTDRALDSMETSLGSTETVLEVAYRYNRPILISSDCGAYGPPTCMPLREDQEPLRGSVRAHEGRGISRTTIDEALARAYYQEHGLPTVIARFFNIAGSQQASRVNGMLRKMVRQALRDEPITLSGDGYETASFCHVEDVVRALPMLLQNPLAHGEVFNIGNPEEVTILELATIIRDVAQSQSTIHVVSAEEACGSIPDDPQTHIPCVDKIQSIQNWQPQQKLKTIVEEVVALEMRLAVHKTSWPISGDDLFFGPYT